MHQKRYWLDYDPVALAVLVIGIGMIELLALSIWPRHLWADAERRWRCAASSALAWLNT